MKKWHPVVFSVVIILLVFLTYWGIWDTYFQQDEWNGFGKVLYAKDHGWLTLVRFYGSHFTPFSSLFFAVLFFLFGFQAAYYGFFSIILHCVNSILVFFLARRMVRSTVGACIASGVFATAYVSRQAVLWFAASASFLPATFFALIGLVMFELALEKSKSAFLAAGAIFILMSLGFRENAIFLYGYMIVRVYVTKKDMLKKTISVLGVFGAGYLLLRFAPIFLYSGNVSPVSQMRAVDVMVQAGEFIFVSLPQVLIPRTLGISIGRFVLTQQPIVSLYGVRVGNVPLFIETVFIRFFYFSIFIIITFFVYRFMKRTSGWRFTTLGSLLSYMALSVLPFSMLPRNLFMESRHFYLTEIGFAICAGFILSLFLKSQRFVALAFTIVIVVISFNMSGVRSVIRASVPRSKMDNFLTHQLKELYPTVPSKVLFYSEQDQLSRQFGAGYMMMVLYHDRQPYEVLMKEDFLWNLGSQGYKETEGVGFGYFTEFEALKEAYCSLRFTRSGVFSFSWNESDQKLTDTSEITRKKLSCNI